MTISDGVLWQASDQGRNWLRWTRRAAVTILIGAVGVLIATAGREPVFGYLVAGGAAIVAVTGAVYLVWDRTRFVEVRLSEGPATRFDIRMVTGRVVQVVPEDVTDVQLICTYGPYDPDYHRDNDTRTSDAVLLLELRNGRVGYRSRARNCTYSTDADEFRDEWKRRCPQARVQREVRFRTPGTGD